MSEGGKTLFDKCIKCERLGQECMPNLMQLSFSDLLKWWEKRQKYLEWSNQKLADNSTIPLATINRIKSGDHEDCRYYTIKKILVALIGGIADEFHCKEKFEQELQRIETLEKQAAKAAELEKENAALKERLAHIDEVHRNDARAIRAEYREEIAFLKDQIKAWQHHDGIK